ncbi:23S rRNA (adenine(2503)-C(2))-methyltransferase RlmN [Eggerthellaceae bacterium zg-887]|nr:23S rRNA (adenine(2503)-C(2))-methyltransferase RlmN [Xiamenia xianingshaonis]
MTSNVIQNLSFAELQGLVADLGQPKFRAQQLYQWLYKHHAADYDAMTNLPAALRESLAETWPYRAARIDETQVSADGTRKYLVTFSDGVVVETVAIPSDDEKRLTVCVSTQAGCAMGCVFCATGLAGLARNLAAGEIVEQVLLAQADCGRRVSNVVFMGQGEPFLNFDSVLKALRILNDPDAVGIGARAMTVSTCGIISGIEALANVPEQFSLAVSLHAADQKIRDSLMPKVRHQKLTDLKTALATYQKKTNRRVTLEYIMIHEVNDSPEDLAELVAFTRGLLCHVNLIPVNAVPDSAFQPSPKDTFARWEKTLREAGVETTVRESRGQDIAGACGQLKNTRAAR